MISLDDIFRWLRNNDHRPPNNSSGSGGAFPPLTPDGQAAAKQAARDALAPKQSDESHLVIRQFGQDGDVLQHSEEWNSDKTGMKVVQKEARVPTSTGELVEPKDIHVACQFCGGFDSVVTHCRCGMAVCRCCLRHDPADGSSLCPQCYRFAVENFNTWNAHDRQRSKKDSQ